MVIMTTEMLTTNYWEILGVLVEDHRQTNYGRFSGMV